MAFAAEYTKTSTASRRVRRDHALEQRLHVRGPEPESTFSPTWWIKELLERVDLVRPCSRSRSTTRPGSRSPARVPMTGRHRSSMAGPMRSSIETCPRSECVQLAPFPRWRRPRLGRPSWPSAQRRTRTRGRGTRSGGRLRLPATRSGRGSACDPTAGCGGRRYRSTRPGRVRVGACAHDADASASARRQVHRRRTRCCSAECASTGSSSVR